MHGAEVVGAGAALLGQEENEMRRVFVVAFVAVLALAGGANAGLSGNLFKDGNFENNSYLKNSSSLDALGNMIPIQRFNKDADWGLWEAIYGVPSLGGGFSTMDNPRDPADPRPLTRDGRDVGNYNISVDPTNPSNHVMENVNFRPCAAQWVKAPALQKSGPVSFSFDFNYQAWLPGFFGDFIEVAVYGLNFQPVHDVGIMYSPVSRDFDMGPGSFLLPMGDFNDDPAGLDGQVLERFDYGGWFTDGRPDRGGTNGWKHVTSSDPNSGWYALDPDNQGRVVVNTSMAQTYQYYAISIYTQTYGEKQFEFVTGAIIPTFAMAFDNFDFRMTTAMLADVNLDGARNALDISSFIQRVTAGPYQIEADCNQDGAVNALDIAKFIYYVTGGTGDAGLVPEPVTLGLLALGAMGLMRRP
jgi:hypothetical protein